MAKHKQWYVTRKPSNEYVMYDFARSAAQAKDMLRDLSEGSPIAHRSKSEGGLYNIYVKKGSVYWREKGGKTQNEYKVEVLIDDEIDLGTNVFADSEDEAMDKAEELIRERNSEYEDSGIDVVNVTKINRKGGKMKQGYNDRMDDSLGNRTGKASSKEQDYKDRRDEAKAMNKAEGKRAYQSVGTMDKMADGGKVKMDSIKDTKEHFGYSNEEWNELSKEEKIEMREMSHRQLQAGSMADGGEVDYEERISNFTDAELLKKIKGAEIAVDRNRGVVQREIKKRLKQFEAEKKRRKMADGGGIDMPLYRLSVVDDSGRESYDNSSNSKSDAEKIFNEYKSDGIEVALEKRVGKKGNYEYETIKSFDPEDDDFAKGGGVGKPRLKRGDTIEVDANKWQDSNGNTYHIVQVYVNDHYLGESDLTYGYGSQYEQTANDMLFDHYKPPYGYKTDNPIYRLKEKGIDVRSRGEYVKRKRDLRRFEKGGKTDDWIQGVEAEMKKKGTVGAFTKQAKRAGMTVKEFTKEVLDNPDKYSKRTRERAQFAKNVSKYESGGDVGGWETNPNGTHYNLAKGGAISSKWFEGYLDFLNY